MIGHAATQAPRIPVGLEEGSDGVVHVHTLSLTGCIVSGSDREEALAAFAHDLSEWLRFVAASGGATPPIEAEIQISVDEWVATGDPAASGSIVCFERDRDPLRRAEIVEALVLLGSLRGRLLPHIRRSRNQDLERMAGPDYSLRTVLEELARAQWWTLTRLGASPLAALPEQTVGRLDTAIALVVDRLTNLPEEGLGLSLVLDGEEWTPRKVLRRLLWLEWSLGRVALGAIETARVGDP